MKPINHKLDNEIYKEVSDKIADQVKSRPWEQARFGIWHIVAVEGIGEVLTKIETQLREVHR